MAANGHSIDLWNKESGAVEFQFPSDIPMDKDFTLQQLLGGFQGVRDGLPELVKNSKDQYTRLGIGERLERQILVLVDTTNRRLVVLDFAGARRSDFELWKVWSNPHASRAHVGGDIEGGHGNGGKAFMVRGSSLTSFMESCFEGRRSKLGFNNTDAKHRHFPGYAKEDGKPIDDTAETHPKARLDRVLRRCGVKYGDLPAEARQVFERRQAFTAVEVNAVTDWENRRKKTIQGLVNTIAADLASHPQAALTLESCSVTVIVDGMPRAEGAIKPIYPPPMPGFEDLPPIHVPDSLVDPDTGEKVQVGEGTGDDRYLQLRTSNTHLRTREHKALNLIRVRNARNIVANLSVPDLVPQNEAAFIYGELKVPGLQESHLSGADRKGLADTPLTRALRQWSGEKVEALANRIQRALAKSHKPQDREKANDSLRAIRELMRKYIDPDQYQGDERGTGTGRKGEGGEGDNPSPRPSERGSVVEEVILEPGRSRIAVAAGTSIPLVIRCLERRPGEDPLPVLAKGFRLHSDHELGLALDEHNVLRAQLPGIAHIWVEEIGSGVKSGQIEVESVLCTGADIIGIERLLLKGERLTVRVSFHTTEGHREDLLIDGSVDETDMGRFGRSGVFTAGRNEGPATVRVRFGAKPAEAETTTLRIGPDSLPPGRVGGQDGGNIPQILLCGSIAPNTEDLPPEQRTLMGGEYHPTIIEEPMFDNIVWINPDSKEASRVRQGRGGTKGSASIGTKTFTQFVALKCFEILKRLVVRREVSDRLITELQFRDYLAEAELKCAEFVDEAYALADELAEGHAEEKPS